MIYVLDDDDGIRFIYETILPPEGYSVKTFASANEALVALAKPPRPSLLLVDCELQISSGAEFLRELYRQFPDFRPASKVVGLSAHVGGGVLLRSFESLVDLYFEKPSDIDRLVDTIRKILPP